MVEECGVCGRDDGAHKMSCRPENRAARAERLTNEEIERGLELEAAATPGPWEKQPWGDGGRVLDPHGHTVTDDDGMYGIMTAPDAELIAWARNHLPALLAEVRAYRSGEPTDEMVEAAARVVFDGPGYPGAYTWAELVVEDKPRADLFREDARAVLRAALGGEQA